MSRETHINGMIITAYSSFICLLVELQQLLRLWRNKWFFRARQKTDKLVKLHRYAVEEGLSIKECVQIATGLTKRLRFLHERNLIQSDLDFKDIYIQKEVSVSTPSIKFEVLTMLLCYV